MTIVLMGLAVWFFVRLLKQPVAAPWWLWELVTLASALAVVLVQSPGYPWWTFVAVAAVATVASMLENLIIVKTDEGLLRINRRR